MIRLLALACLQASALPVAPPTPTVSARSIAVPQPNLPSSARRTLVSARPLGSVLRLGEHELSATPGHPPKVARRPDGKPTLRLKHRARYSVALPEAREPRGVELLFEEHDGDWFYGSAQSRRFDLGPASIHLVDIDLDGAYSIQEDAWSLEPGGPLQRLSGELVLGATRVRIESLEASGEQMVTSATPLEGTDDALRFLARLNLLRAGEGLPAVSLNPELSAGCTEHARYLWANREVTGLDPAEQDPRLPGATRAGRAASRQITLIRLSSEEALTSYWESADGRWILSDPGLLEIGLSSIEQPLTLLDTHSRTTHRETQSRAWQDALTIPAAGSHNQPLSAPPAEGQGTRRQGPPLMLRRGPHQAAVERYEFELFKVTASSRARVGSRLLPRSAEWPERFGGRARRALAPDSEYVAVHRLLLDGVEHIIEARFRTGPRPPGAK